MLVDDEMDVLMSIARTVEWEKCGFTLCGCAAGALEAMEMAAAVLPDVVMTDICMPYMDGLEMIERLSQMYPAMQFVVLSGYDEFAYAQKALKFHVMDYLLKPLSAEGMREALRKINQRLNADTARRRDIESLKEQARKDKALLERTDLMELLLESANEYAGMPDRPAANLFPAHLALMEEERTGENEAVLQNDFKGQQDLLRFSLQKIAQELLEAETEGQCLCHRGRFVLLLRCAQDTAVALMTKIMDTIRMYLHLSVKAALSYQVTRPEDLSGVYQRALLLIGSEATFAGGSLFLMEESSRGGDAEMLAGNLPGEMALLLRSGDEGRIHAYFAQLAQLFGQSRVSSALLFALCSMVQSAVFTTAMRAGLSAEDVLPLLEQHRPIYPLETDATLKMLCRLAQEAARLILQRNRAGGKEMAARIRAYIDQHYHKTDLSTNDVCDAFHISQTQLSLIFKREMGKSFLQFVLDKRIARAKELLLGTDEKIYRIALETGFEDPGYFSYCFKQRCGVTPKNFRQGAGQNA